MNWRIQLKDQHGTFWLTDRENMWSDSADDALVFMCQDTAEKAATLARGRVSEFKDWFPRVRVIKFKEFA
jgi:hypothetical protein